jgi:hypothetical protein
MASQRWVISSAKEMTQSMLTVKMTIHPCNVTPERGMYGKSETVNYRWGPPAGTGFLPCALCNYRTTD